MQTAKRIEKLPPYLFVGISKKIAEKRARGEDVISFGIGDPDLPTPPHVIQRLCEAARDPANHRYPEVDGLPQLRRAIADWYQHRFELTFDPDKEILPLIGSKEGIGHMSFCFIDPGDIALVPDPGYPVYSMSTILAGGEPHYLPLIEENGFLPDLEKIPAEVAAKARILWLNYPNNPTAAVAGLDFFERAVAFARKHDLAICHDAPYTEVAFDGYRPVSFLQAPGAKDVGVEFHSLSKSYNMTGWRVGMAVGNEKMINALMRLKSNLDSGIPQAIQHAAIAAFTGSQDCISEHNLIYQRRRDLVIETLGKIGIAATPPRASLYVWARIPEGYSSAGFAARLLDEVGIVVTPGTGYGACGEGYIRISLTTPDDRLQEGLARLEKWHNSPKPVATSQ
ncbi:LL-diaminopimelate aminotransferase [Dehalococcoidia bacterium]|nr:LL-diaminopimelate aminotransferase [Dehalococcoidia bacterium]